MCVIHDLLYKMLAYLTLPPLRFGFVSIACVQIISFLSRTRAIIIIRVKNKNENNHKMDKTEKKCVRNPYISVSAVSCDRYTDVPSTYTYNV